MEQPYLQDSRSFLVLKRISLLLLATGLVGCGREEPYFDVYLSDSDAFTVASLVLTEGRVRGCGDFKVVRQFPRSKSIYVECNDGTTKTEHEVKFFPSFRVDGRETTANAWDRRWLQGLYCVKSPDGKWDKAFIKLDDARDRAEELSTAADKESHIYSTGEDSKYYWQSFKRSTDAKWSVTIPQDEVRDEDLRVGCELRK